jgi:predicted metal-dependent hydrolase
MWKRFLTKNKTSVIEDKTIVINSEIINYKHIKKEKKNISLRINESGLTVSSPFHASQNIIESIIQKKSSWILKNISQYKNKKNDIETISKINLVGDEFNIILSHDQSRIDPINKIIYLKSKNKEDELRKLLKDYALIIFNDRLKKYIVLTSFKVESMKLTNAKTKWGSCSSSREIRMNWRLVLANINIIDYVLCHELAHLSFMNHSKQFWAEVGRLMPGYIKYKKELKNRSLEFYILN